MNLTDSQKKALKEVDGILNNAHIDIVKFEYQELGSGSLAMLGAEIVEAGQMLLHAAVYPYGKETE